MAQGWRRVGHGGHPPQPANSTSPKLQFQSQQSPGTARVRLFIGGEKGLMAEVEAEGAAFYGIGMEGTPPLQPAIVPG